MAFWKGINSKIKNFLLFYFLLKSFCTKINGPCIICYLTISAKLLALTPSLCLRSAYRSVRVCGLFRLFCSFISCNSSLLCYNIKHVLFKLRTWITKRKRKRSDSVLWQKLLQPQKIPKSNMTMIILRLAIINTFIYNIMMEFKMCSKRTYFNTYLC